MAAADTPTAGGIRYGLNGDGSILLTDGRSFPDASHLVAFMRQHPDYVFAHRRELQTVGGGRYFALAGYRLASGNKMVQFDGSAPFGGNAGTGSKVLRYYTPSAKEKSILDSNSAPDAPQAVHVNPKTGKLTTATASSTASRAKAAGSTNRSAAVAGAAMGDSGPVRTQAQGQPPVVINTAPTTDVGGALTAPLTKQQQKLLASLFGTKITAGTKVNPQALVKMLGGNVPQSLIDQLTGQAGIQRQLDFLSSLKNQSISDAAAHQANIGSWYKEANDSLATQAARDQAINAATVGSIRDTAKGIVSAIGGEANPGSGMAAATGQQGADLASALGQANEEYNADLGPILAMGEAGAKSQAQSDDRSALQSIEQQILQTQSQGDSQAAQAALQAYQMNQNLAQNRAQTLLGATQANNAIDQQGFANRLSLGNSLLAAQNLGLNIASLGATVNTNTGRIAASNAATLGRIQTAQANAAAKAAEARSKALQKAAAPMSPAELRAAETAADKAITSMQQQGALAHNVAGGIQAIKAAYGVNAYSNRATRQAAYTSAVRHLTGVKVDPAWFGLGAGSVPVTGPVAPGMTPGI